jgi:hypothetical protein
VISIGGASRSGSTLLSLLLGRLDGYFPVGELRYFWSRAYVENMLCGCGEPFRECSFWRDVLKDAYGGFDKVPIEEVTELHDSVAHIRHFPQLIAPVTTSRFKNKRSRYLDHLDRLCKAIQNVSGANTIVDSSKLPTFCYLLSKLPDTDVQLVQLVRDSRAVAFSFMRKKHKPDVHWKFAYMQQFSPARSATDWDVLNLGMEMLRTSSAPYQRIRYEDLVREPRGELSRIFPSITGAVGDFLDGDKIPLPVNHSVSGNPLRFTKGAIRIRPDTEWRERMKKSDYALVTALSWPLLLRYGYVRPRR